MTHLPHSTIQYTLENIRTKSVRTKKFRTQTILGLSFLLGGISGALGGFFAATLSSSPSPSEVVLLGEVTPFPTVPRTSYGEGGSDEVAGDFVQQPDNQQPDNTTPTSPEESIDNTDF
jgi:hypothetical protein